MIRSKLKRKAIIIKLPVLILLISVSIIMTACSGFIPGVEADDLMEDVVPGNVTGKQADERFISNTADFAIDLFKESISNQKNSLVSPVSVMLALAMTTNGADGETLSQMEEVLGRDISIDELNQYLYYYTKNLPNEEKSKLKIANSIWFRDEENRFTVEKDFLQKNADYYHAEVFKAPFTDETLSVVNNWVKTNTDDMIDKILEEIAAEDIMYLLNAIVFDAEWKVVYNKDSIYQDEFTTADGTKVSTDFMGSEESLYLEDGNAVGFIKPYYNDKYSFVALLPNEGVDFDSYIEGLSGEKLLSTIRNAKTTVVNATVPKFSYEFDITLNDVLKSLGMSYAFDSNNADFSKLGKSTRGNIYIGKVIHKTFISLDERGTKAGAATLVVVKDESAPVELKIIKLDRPFVYAIIDNKTKLPLFIGTVLNPVN